MTARLTTQSLVVGYRATPVIGPVDLALEPGLLTCLLGANGAGKSTLMRTLTGMQKPLSGRIFVESVEIDTLHPADRARKIAVVLTDRVQSGLMLGRDVVELGRYPYLGWSGRLGAQDQKLVDRALQDAGAESLAQRPVAEMSDGERQRIMLARALAQTPRILVLDEITAFLDLPRRVETMELLRSIAVARDIAILLSTHDLELALRCSDETWLVDRAKVLHVGAPEDLVLNGALEATFCSDQLAFDHARGELHAVTSASIPLKVMGEGVAAIWLKRAVVRAGFVVSEEAPHAVQVEAGGYRLVSQAGHREYDSIAGLVAALRGLKAVSA